MFGCWGTCGGVVRKIRDNGGWDTQRSGRTVLAGEKPRGESQTNKDERWHTEEAETEFTFWPSCQSQKLMCLGKFTVYISFIYYFTVQLFIYNSEIFLSISDEITFFLFHVWCHVWKRHGGSWRHDGYLLLEQRWVGNNLRANVCNFDTRQSIGLEKGRRSAYPRERHVYITAGVEVWLCSLAIK